MIPDFDTAATKAAETLIRYNITSAPVDPLAILKHTPGVLVTTFAEASESIGMERSSMLRTFDAYKDAVTTVRVGKGKLDYIVIYNQKLASYIMMNSLARELGHIVLGHDGSRPEEVRNAESICFAMHLLRPRAMINAFQEAGITFSYDLFCNLTGGCDQCANLLLDIPGTKVPAELNRKIRERFAGYISDLSECLPIFKKQDHSQPIDLTKYMEGYEE